MKVRRITVECGFEIPKEQISKSVPILFSPDMVRSILNGTKTMTRRVVKDLNQKCPYGEVGSILWVRETHYVWGVWKQILNNVGAPVFGKSGRMKWKFVPVECKAEVCYSDNPPEFFKISKCDMLLGVATYYKRLARFMPRKYCRLYLEVTDIRIERLNDISNEDAEKEGINKVKRVLFSDYAYRDYLNEGEVYRSAISSFRSLWEKINGIGTWDVNPWVWVVTFKQVERPSVWK